MCLLFRLYNNVSSCSKIQTSSATVSSKTRIKKAMVNLGKSSSMPHYHNALLYERSISSKQHVYSPICFASRDGILTRKNLFFEC